LEVTGIVEGKLSTGKSARIGRSVFVGSFPNQESLRLGKWWYKMLNGLLCKVFRSKTVTLQDLIAGALSYDPHS